jgi:hypothetical protein
VRKFFSILSIIFISILTIFISKVPSQKLDPAPLLKPDLNFGKIPLYFISNEGQVHKQAEFYAKASRYTLWITKEGLVFDSTKRSEVRGQESEDQGHRREAMGHGGINPKFEARNTKQIKNPKSKFPKQKTKNPPQQIHNSTNKPLYQRDVSRLVFVGANKHPEIIPLNQTKLKVNYFKGNDPSKWVGDIPTSQAVLYKCLYKNIDLKVYGIEKQIEYDWIVKPGADPEDIQFEYKNVKRTRIDKDGNLVITTKFGQLIHKKPLSYQKGKIRNSKSEIRNKSQNPKFKIPNQKIDVGFKKIKKNTYRFNIGEYDKNIELIIDPVILAYSTYLGGSNEEGGFGIVVDGSGYAYLVGETLSTDFPTLNPYQASSGGDYDAFVTKLDTTVAGSDCLIYSTYLGGAWIDHGKSIAVHGTGLVYVTGYTEGSDFPILNQYMAYPGDAKRNVFVTKLDTTQSGTSSLLYSTYLGGDNDDYGYGIDTDSSGYTYVTGYTLSTDFPCVNQYQTNPSTYNYEVFVSKLDTTQSGATSLLYSTYLGGATSSDHGQDIAVDSSGYAYVTGYTGSTDYPTINQYQSDQPGGDAFLSKIDATQSGTASLVYSTYLGGSGTDFGYGLCVDASGIAYVTGETSSADFPILNEYQSHQVAQDAFVTKIDTNISGTGGLRYSTYLGGEFGEYGNGITADNSGNVYVTGKTSSTDFPCFNELQTKQPSFDAFVTRLDTAMSGVSSLIFSTYLGGESSDRGDSIDIDSSGYIYITGRTSSLDFPLFRQYQGLYGGNSDVFITKLSLVSQYPLVLTQSVSPITSSSAVCGGKVVLEGNSAVTARGVCWSASPNPTIFDTYTVNGSGPGTYVSSLPGLTPETTYYVRAYAANNEGLDYGAEFQFTTLPISVTVTSPNGGESFCLGTVENITWIPDGITNPLYIILQQNDTNVALIAKGINPDLGTYSWIVGDCKIGTAAAGANYKILLKEKNSTVKDKSDASFTIVDPYITVTSPNGGESWAMSSTKNITWNSAGLTGNLYIVLQGHGINAALIAKNIDPSLGTYTWSVGDCIQGSVTTGWFYKILIAEKGTGIKDKSDAEFSIISE